MKARAHQAYGFTLIELLVVIGLIAVLTAGVGVAFTTGGKGTALQGAQGLVNSLLSGARGQAAIHQARAALFVNVDPDTDGFLREFQIAVDDGAGKWRVTGDATLLDKGIYVVTDKARTGLTSDLVYKGDWTDLYSTAYETNGAPLNLYLSDGSTKVTAPDGSAVGYRIVQIFTPLGTVDTSSPAPPTAPEMMKLVLAGAESGIDPKLTFNNPDALRGVVITTYGVPLFVNEAHALKP